MSIVFEKPNYTQIPNIYLDELMYVLSPTENTIMLFLMRKILGWHKEKDIISYSQIEKATGLSRPTVIKAVKVLEKTGLIKTKPTTKGVFIELVIYEKEGEKEEKEGVKNFNQLKNLTSSSKEILPLDSESGKEILPTKEILKKSFKESDDYKSCKELAVLLYSLHKEIDDKFKRTSEQLEKWINHIYKIYSIDGRSYEQIESVIKWVKQDDFWQKNIIGAETLRRQFDKVCLRVPTLKTTYIKTERNKTVFQNNSPSKPKEYCSCGGEIKYGVCVLCRKENCTI